MTAIETYRQHQPDEIRSALVGRRIVRAELGDFPDAPDIGYGERPEGRLVLDDGSTLYLKGNDGGCACNAGCYPLAKVAAFDNAITGVSVEANPTGDFDDDWDRTGTYRIFVFTDSVAMNVAEFAGTDGNGYYGTGFEVAVVPGPAVLTEESGR